MTKLITALPNGKQQFLDGNGKPLAAGTVGFYIPGGMTPKNTWQDPAQGVLNANPVVLDAAGEALIYGYGTYRQILKDSLGNVVWDQLSQDISEPVQNGIWLFGGTSSGGAAIYNVTLQPAIQQYTAGQHFRFLAHQTSVGNDVININGLGNLALTKWGTTPIAASDIVIGQMVEVTYDGNNAQLENSAPGVSGVQQSGNVTSGNLAIWAGSGGPTQSIRDGGPFPSVPLPGWVRLRGTGGGTSSASWTVAEITAETNTGGAFKGVNLTFNFNGAIVGANGMDSGGFPASADISIYAIYNPNTLTWACLGSVVSSAMTYTGGSMPAGYTASCLIFAGCTTAGGLFQSFRQLNDLVGIPDTGVLSVNVTVPFSGISMTNVVPALATGVFGYCDCNIPSGGAYQAELTLCSDTSMNIGNSNASLAGNLATSIRVNMGEILVYTPLTIYYSAGITGPATLDLIINQYRFAR